MNKNADLDIKIYKIIYTQDFREELANVYNYIADVLKEKEISNRFILIKPIMNNRAPITFR